MPPSKEKHGNIEIKHKSAHTYIPGSVNELLQVYADHPGAVISAGGTYLYSTVFSESLPSPLNIISLKNIDELRRITRSERYLEVGACAPINSIVSISKKLLPGPLYDVLFGIATPTVRNMATLGGNLCVPGKRMDSASILSLLEARLEIRSSTKSSWIPISRFFNDDGSVSLGKGEVLTRIRIPLDDWNIGIYKKYGFYPFQGMEYLSFCGIAKEQRNILSDFRVAFSAGGPKILRNREIEAQLNGRRLPLMEKGRLPSLAAFQEILEETPYISPFLSARAFRLFRSFLTMLGQE